MVLGLDQGGAQRRLEHAALGEVDLGDGVGRVDVLCQRDGQAGPAELDDEVVQDVEHVAPYDLVEGLVPSSS